MIFRPRPAAVALLSLAAGTAAAFAHPPAGLLPGLLGYALLLHLVDRTEGPRPLRSAFWRGWLCGFGYFLVSCWWVAEAFMVDARGQGWMAPFAVLLLPSGLGLFWGAAMALYRATRPEGPLRVLAFAGFLTAAEWVRGHLLTGFPWNLPGETWAAGGAVSQTAALMGAYGLTWLTLAVAAAFALPFGGSIRGQSWRRRLAPAALSTAVIATMWIWGDFRLRHAVAGPDPSAPLIRVVQADVKQEAKYTEDSLRAIFARYLSLTVSPASGAPDVVVWSEGALPISANDLLAPGGEGEAALRAVLHPGQTLLLGAYRAEGEGAKERYFNSLIAVRAELHSLRVTGVYDKHRLVPFGEFLPAEPILEAVGFKSLAHLGDGFSHGPPPAPLVLPGLPTVQPLICYESLFPDLVRDAVRRGPARPRWIVNVSNDAWFGMTSGPVQHLNQSSYRAIEQGLPIVRATPTGISAVIDAYGRIPKASRLGFGRMEAVDVRLPPPLNPTTYGRLGEVFLAAFFALSLFTIRRDITSRLQGLAVTMQGLWQKD